ncbi:hypothetical protein [Paraflavitalea sp. CAU 1676]|uniref:hypothetical protein n=1 Tax=Paraflavitalea sp. CAU 1676 TaxID=3032598 RepID=UPI0023DA8778|nr:hypothetical protein [Paraflavitalea sp. CAU 1676]MDF2190149.1 hypothetical protein [Paraflavitalea sp. CAU 1676]
MKKISTAILLLLFVAGATAQYKKASFFESTGRTYGINGKLHAMGDGKGSPIGINLSFGRDRDGKRVFTFWEFAYVPGYKFTFDSKAYNGNPVTITGKTNPQISYSYNWGLHLLKNEEEPKKIQPYLTWGLHLLLSGGMKEYDGGNYDSDKIPADGGFTCGLGGGAGVLYNITPGFGIKLEGGYTYLTNLSLRNKHDAKEYYNLYSTHPYVTAGVRFRIWSK